MRKILEVIELPISENYVEHWSIYEALRELYQNAIDRQNVTKETMVSEYSKESEILCIGNRKTTLSKSTLVLGNSAKKGDSKQIGNFGEGYKLALVVLLRAGLKVTIENGGTVWEPSLEHSSTFDTKVLSIAVRHAEAGEDLIFKIEGVRRKVYHGYTQRNLYLQPGRKSLTTEYGEILLDERNKAKLFIGGLYICRVGKDYAYGYNFNNGIIPVDRDRMKVEAFNVSWYTSRMLTKIDKGSEGIKRVKSLISSGSAEARYYASHSGHNVNLSSDFYKEFKAENPLCIPVEAQSDLKELEKKYQGVKAIVVGDRLKELYSHAPEYEEDIYMLEPREVKSPYEMLLDFVNKYGEFFSEALKVKYANELLPLADQWTNK